MSWSEGISKIEDILVLLALVGAIWSAIRFVEKTVADIEAARLAKLASWRKAALQEMIATSPEFLSCKQITEKLRASSFNQAFDIKREDLTEQSVRLLLLDLVRDGIVWQVFNDLYGLNQFRHDPTSVVMADHVRANLAFRRAFDLVLKYPGHHSDDTLFGELGQEIGLGKGDFVLALSDMASRRVAEKDKHGKWSPTAPTKETN